MNSYTLTLPMPPACLHPNSPGVHWGTKTREKKKYARQVMICCLHQFGSVIPVFPKATIQLHWQFNTKRKRDDDNLTAWFKHGQDTLAKCGFVADDNDFTPLPHTVEIDNGSTEVVLVTITRI